jgi:electron transport complex protein RnfC
LALNAKQYQTSILRGEQMRAKTFRGGIHLHYCKEATAGQPIMEIPEPKQVFLPIQQHIGAPAEVCVAVGDQVKIGDPIATAKGFVSVPVHASIAGKVTEIKDLPQATGRKVKSIVIENDFSGASNFLPVKPLEQYTAAELKELMRQIGLVGMGGAGFPTHVKYSPPEGKTLQMVILNGAECEPYLTCDHRLMVEQPDRVVLGLRALMQAAGVTMGFIGVETNKPDAIAALTKEAAADPRIKVVPLEVKYPQGEEKMLIKSVTGRIVPAGGLPADVGVAVNNIATAVTLAGAILEGTPLISRIVTVTGAVRESRNLKVRLGTLVSEVVEFCGGFSGTPGRIVLGGPMTGPAQYRLDIPIVKNTSGVLAQERGMIKLLSSSTCVRCAHCVDICPYQLMPCFIADAIEAGDLARAEAYGIMDCRECGSCTFACPAQRPIIQSVKSAKAKILANRKK